MQRSSWSGVRYQSDAEEARGRVSSYSKAPRKQGLGRELRIAWQQKKVTARMLAVVVAAACLLLILWGLAVQLEIYSSADPSAGKSPEDRRALFNQQLTALIERTETERQKALSELQPAFKGWRELKAAAAEARQRLRESKAGLTDTQELHAQRLNILPAAKGKQGLQGADHQETAADLKQEWQEEVDAAKDTLHEVSEQDKDLMYSEGRARRLVESLRQEVQALGAALAEYVEQRNSPLMKPARGARQPGNAFDRGLLLNVFSRNLEGLTRKRSLRDENQIEQQAAAVLETLQHPLTLAAPPHLSSHDRSVEAELKLDSSLQAADGGTLRGNLKQEQDAGAAAGLGAKVHSAKEAAKESVNFGGKQQAELAPGNPEGNPVRDESAVTAALKDLQAASGLLGDVAAGIESPPGQAGGLVEIAIKPEGGDLGVAKQLESVGKIVRSGASRAMLPDSTEKSEEAAGWLSSKWADRSSGIIGADEVDASLRCSESRICEGATACKPGLAGSLGCITQNLRRQEAVQEAARWSWDAYRKHAFGKDELLPLSQTHDTWFDLGLTLVDSLDTLLLLGLDVEYEEARKWVATELRTDPDKAVNLFETTIRVLGGLLAAFHLSNGDKVMLYKAASLALRLVPAFNSKTGIPFSDINLKTHGAEQPQWTTFSSLSEVTSLSLEFSFLGRATGDQNPAEKALHAVRSVLEMDGRLDGLAPIYVDITTAALRGHLITLGARGDSYYEYLLKQWLLSGKKADFLLKGYEESMRGVRKRMLMRTDKDGLLFVGELNRGNKVAKMDHLVCFLPGLLALGHHHGVNTANPGEPDDLEVAEDLMRTCYEMYRRTPTGLAPEIAFFKSSEAHDVLPQVEDSGPGGGDFVIKRHDSHNLLRPETMESLFVLWRVTGKTHFQEWAWAIFRAFEMHTRVETGGYANLDSCLGVPPPKRDKMESFWLAETLKYLYLTLDDSSPALLSLDEYVFNTEAHPFPVEGTVADVLAGHAYETAPYSAATNFTLDERIQYWEDLAKVEAGRARIVLKSS